MTQALSKLNFRDLGGLPAEGGRLVRRGLLYRNEGPASLSEDHRQELVALNIKLVCDLRAGVERDEAPNDWTTARLFNLDITNDLRAETNEGWSALKDDPSAAGARKAMRMNYAAIPGALLPHLQPLADAILAGETPVLIHCTAGKDRTGVLVALLLLLLGVPKEHVVADYLRSDVFARNLRLGGSITHAFEETFGFTPSEDTIAAMIGVDTDFLNAALDTVTTRWRSIEGYFDVAGIDAAKRAALHDALVERG
ncbi:tyrosine-protein phosphatase [Sphingomonas oryzagri]